MLQGLEHKTWYHWIVLVVSYLLMLLFAFPLQALPPMLSLIMEDIHFNNSLAGLLMGSYGIPGFFMPVAAAVLASKYNQKKLALVALGIMAAGVVAFAAASSYWTLLAGRLASGVGAKIILSIAPLFVIRFFEHRNLGTVIGVFNTAVPLGSILAMNLFGFLGERLGWRMSILVIAVLIAVAAAALNFLLYLPPDLAGGGNALNFNRDMGEVIWYLGGLNFLINIVTMAYITFAPSYFHAAGLSSGEANLLTSLIMIETAALGPLAGFVVDRFGIKKPLVVLAALVLTMCFIVLPFAGRGIFFWIILLGIGAAIVPVVVFPLMRDVIGQEATAMAIAILIIASNMGSTLGPVLFGWVLDYHGFGGGFFMLAGFSLLILPVTFRIRSGSIRLSQEDKKKLPAIAEADQ